MLPKKGHFVMAMKLFITFSLLAMVPTTLNGPTKPMNGGVTGDQQITHGHLISPTIASPLASVNTTHFLFVKVSPVLRLMKAKNSFITPRFHVGNLFSWLTWFSQKTRQKKPVRMESSSRVKVRGGRNNSRAMAWPHSVEYQRRMVTVDDLQSSWPSDYLDGGNQLEGPFTDEFDRKLKNPIIIVTESKTLEASLPPIPDLVLSSTNRQEPICISTSTFIITRTSTVISTSITTATTTNTVRIPVSIPKCPPVVIVVVVVLAALVAVVAQALAKFGELVQSEPELVILPFVMAMKDKKNFKLKSVGGKWDDWHMDLCRQEVSSHISGSSQGGSEPFPFSDGDDDFPTDYFDDKVEKVVKRIPEKQRMLLDPRK